MANITSKVLFLTTSPRTPAKMIPEIALLNRHFAGRPWNNENQQAFMVVLRDENYFNGMGENDPAFSARDRINRAPQMLGFVKLKPLIELTPAGKMLICKGRTDEVFLRQLLKFQIPSPYHIPSESAATFWIRPYLELFRLIRHFGSLKFDELKIFGLQMTDYRNFDKVVGKIEKFREARAKSSVRYKKFEAEYFDRELRNIYREELSKGDIEVRESNEVTERKFLQTKGGNMRDYADACVRYLRATGMVSISHVGKTVSIVQEKIKDVDYFLQNTVRDPCFVDDMEKYVEYLGDAGTPMLYSDDAVRLSEKIHTEFPNAAFNAAEDIGVLKELYTKLVEERKQDTLKEQVTAIKNYKLYEDIQEKYQQINDGLLYDAPLMLEWNTWRAMTMLDGGDIMANLVFDDFGQPLSTAQGNMADIICDYGDFEVSVEVTMSMGQRQYETEGEPVARHLGKIKKESGKEAYCLFVAPEINDACKAHFFMLHRTNVEYYGGKSIIVPLPLNVFQKMVEDSRKADYVPQPAQVREFFEYSNTVALSAEGEKIWYDKIIDKAMNWLRP